jgi:peptide chain release factor 1
MLEEKLQTVEDKYNELTSLLSNPEVLADFSQYQKYSMEQSELVKIVEKFKEYKKILAELKDAEEILAGSADEALRELASTEIAELKEKKINAAPC